MLVLLVRGSRFASSLLLTFLLSWVTLRTSLSEFCPLAFTRALPGGTALAASRPLPTKLKRTQLSLRWGSVCYLAFGDFTALEVLIGRGGAPVVRRPLLPFGTAPLLSTRLGGVGAQEEVEDWE